MIGIILTLVGFFMIFGRKMIITDRKRWQQENLGIKIGKADLNFGEILLVVGGLLIIVFGVLTLLGINKFS